MKAIHEGEAPAGAVETGMEAAREAIRLRAQIFGAEMSDYHCTLILVAWIDDQVAAVQVGDGAAIVESEGVCKMLTVPQRGEYVNETFFLTEPHYQQTKFTREAKGITAVALFTDGLQKEAVDFQRNVRRTASSSHRQSPFCATLERAAAKRAAPSPLQASVETKGALATTKTGM